MNGCMVYIMKNNIRKEINSSFFDLVFILFISFIGLWLFNILLNIATNEYTVKSNFFLNLFNYKSISNLLISFITNNIYQLLLCLFFLKRIVVKLFFRYIRIRNHYILFFLNLMYYSFSFIYLFIYCRYHIPFNILIFLLFFIYLFVIFVKADKES